MSLFSCVKGKKEGSTHVVCVCVVVSSRVREREKRKKETNGSATSLFLPPLELFRSPSFTALAILDKPNCNMQRQIKTLFHCCRCRCSWKTSFNQFRVLFFSLSHSRLGHELTVNGISTINLGRAHKEEDRKGNGEVELSTPGRWGDLARDRAAMMLWWPVWI